MIIATTGHRVRSDWPAGALDAWVIAIDRPEVTEIRWGGAEGWDTISLRTAAGVRLRRPQEWPPLRFFVYAPATKAHIHTSAMAAINDCLGDGEVIELGMLDRDGIPEYNRRNRAMLVGGRVQGGRPVPGVRADLLWACWSGRPSGTGNTVAYARELGIPVDGVGAARAVRT